MRRDLEGEYLIEGRQISHVSIVLSDQMIKVHVGVRVAVSSYSYTKLKELLERYPLDIAVAQVINMIVVALDAGLEMGRRQGGNAVISWDTQSWSYREWEPGK